MADKKEVLDYLRNRQKAAEIEAKVNGINLWVLLGAIGIVAWQLLAYDLAHMLLKPELAVRALLACEAAFLFSWLCSPTRGLRDDLRFSAWRAGDLESPLLVIVEGSWLLLPPVLCTLVVGRELSSVLLGLFGGAFIAMGVTEIVSRLRAPIKSAERFPKPEFKTSPKTDVVGDLVLGGGYLLVVYQQVATLMVAEKAGIDELRAIALVSVLYLLCMVAIRRRRLVHSIQWTYELETDVVLGVLTPEGALRRIEHRALGPRLEDVMNKFFDELDYKLGVFESGLGKCREGLKTVGEIPREFQVERAARISRATADSEKLLKELHSDLSELSTYLEKLGRKKSDSRVASAIEGLVVRRKSYNDRIASAKASLENLKRLASDTE